jgi:hypothetical protein
VGKQINFMLEKDLGFNTDAIVTIDLPWKQDISQRKLFVESLQSLPGIDQMSVHDDLPASGNWSSSIFSFNNESGRIIKTNVFRKNGDENYIPI